MQRNTRGLSFYHRLGAEITEQHGHRCFLRWVPWVTALDCAEPESRKGCRRPVSLNITRSNESEAKSTASSRYQTPAQAEEFKKNSHNS
ncbi:hypothetical protein PI95_022360 [Hassallia byssoidea VB512170]|uniref:Uncharacterized protein n=1 Tax=Hassallia byssoidea VB512170 TaxID=1304833 RepID=A0A846HD48_9CYAN|nr:hypothetical protein [Hassalia byssoidea]NEU75226.1 hypothetical protein [Hassalia byssoidea VB512170]